MHFKSITNTLTLGIRTEAVSVLLKEVFFRFLSIAGILSLKMLLPLLHFSDTLYIGAPSMQGRRVPRAPILFLVRGKSPHALRRGPSSGPTTCSLLPLYIYVQYNNKKWILTYGEPPIEFGFLFVCLHIKYSGVLYQFLLAAF